MKKDSNNTHYIKPINLVNVTYAQTGKSKSTNELGMREMQAKAYEARSAQYLLLKAPPASGKSRALMFIAIDKLINQGLKKVIVAVPERSIGNSFAPNELKKYGFYADWELNNKYNLCAPGSDSSKVKLFKEFLQSDEKVLICTHATLRFAFEGLQEIDFNNCLVAIDEFHHVSADGDNILGNVIRRIMDKSTAHIVAMTGSYFRGDSVPVLLPEDEAKFIKVTYNYYDQLNGYDYLKSLGIGYHFYRGKRRRCSKWFGWIYILKSKSEKPEIKNLENLYKIGFSKYAVQERIKNASKEATYLFADVEVVDSRTCYNVNTQKLEGLIHRFLAEACLDIDLYDKSGNRYIPREWFVVPLNIIGEVIQLLLNGNIVNYKYDVASRKVVLK